MILLSQQFQFSSTKNFSCPESVSALPPRHLSRQAPVDHSPRLQSL